MKCSWVWTPWILFRSRRWVQNSVAGWLDQSQLVAFTRAYVGRSQIEFLAADKQRTFSSWPKPNRFCSLARSPKQTEGKAGQHSRIIALSFTPEIFLFYFVFFFFGQGIIYDFFSVAKLNCEDDHMCTCVYAVSSRSARTQTTSSARSWAGSWGWSLSRSSSGSRTNAPKWR